MATVVIDAYTFDSELFRINVGVGVEPGRTGLNLGLCSILNNDFFLLFYFFKKVKRLIVI
jgi:hypothetical protein